jgi:hypothetical protein
MTEWQNNKNDKMTKWQNDRMTKWQNDKMTKWQNDKSPHFDSKDQGLKTKEDKKTWIFVFVPKTLKFQFLPQNKYNKNAKTKKFKNFAIHFFFFFALFKRSTEIQIVPKDQLKSKSL